jgi:crotonobetaine/carnitine-CoA ligase
MSLADSRRTITDLLRDAVAHAPNAVAVSLIDGRSYTRAEFWDATLTVAAALRASEVGPGDRVLMMVGNRIEFLTTWCGAICLGAYPVPLHTGFIGPILQNLVSATEPKVAVADSAAAGQLHDALEAAGFTGTFVAAGDSDQTLVRGPRVSDFAAWANIEPLHGPVPALPSDGCTIFYSSGTTGPSKGAIWPHNAVYGLAESFAKLGKYGPGDRVHTATPLFHALALVNGFLAPLMAGGGCVLSPRFSVSRFWEEVAKSEATKTMLLGEMVTLIYNREPSELDRAHKVNAAFLAPRPADYFEEFQRRFGLKIFGAFGNTDVGLPMHAPQEEGHPSAVGREIPEWEVRLVDDFDEPVDEGTPGELVARPHQPFLGTLGYWRMPEASVELMRNCWYHTGDILRRSEDGWYHFVDRKKDSMRRGGENISSFEVELVLLSHPDVIEAAVFGVPAELAEDDVMACLVVKPDASLQDIGDYTEARLPYFAAPRYYDIRDSLPLTPTQKIAKALLRKDGITTTTWDRGRVRRRRTDGDGPASNHAREGGTAVEAANS